MPVADAPTDVISQSLAGLDALELGGDHKGGRVGRFWAAAWPKLGAVGLFVFLWQCVVWSGWREEYILPGPVRAARALRDGFADGILQDAIATTMGRAALGFALALVIGVIIGAAVVAVPVLRRAIGSMITGLQTMPSVAWLPLAIVLFGQSEGAIRFVVVLGAAPSIANGFIAGADTIPPLLLRAGRALGASGWSRLRYIVIPAAFPTFFGGLKQGWAFAWRSLMAGELIVQFGRLSLGGQLQTNRDVNDYPGLVATMVVILIIGIVVDGLFTVGDRRIHRRYGLASS